LFDRCEERELVAGEKMMHGVRDEDRLAALPKPGDRQAD